MTRGLGARLLPSLRGGHQNNKHTRRAAAAHRSPLLVRSASALHWPPQRTHCTLGSPRPQRAKVQGTRAHAGGPRDRPPLAISPNLGLMTRREGAREHVSMLPTASNAWADSAAPAWGCTTMRAAPAVSAEGLLSHIRRMPGRPSVHKAYTKTHWPRHMPYTGPVWPWALRRKTSGQRTLQLGASGASGPSGQSSGSSQLHQQATICICHAVHVVVDDHETPGEDTSGPRFLLCSQHCREQATSNRPTSALLTQKL